MKNTTILTTAIIILSSFTLGSCTKDKLNCSNESEFCSLVDNQDFDATGAIIDDYLAGLNKNEPEENLEKLADWLECKTCVEKVEILCNSCIETLPAQSELSVEFNSGGQEIEKTLDILMSDPLRYRGYHD